MRLLHRRFVKIGRKCVFSIEFGGFQAPACYKSAPDGVFDAQFISAPASNGL